MLGSKKRCCGGSHEIQAARVQDHRSGGTRKPGDEPGSNVLRLFVKFIRPRPRTRTRTRTQCYSR